MKNILSLGAKQYTNEDAILLTVDMIPRIESCHCKYLLSTVIENIVPVENKLLLDCFKIAKEQIGIIIFMNLLKPS